MNFIDAGLKKQILDALEMKESDLSPITLAEEQKIYAMAYSFYNEGRLKEAKGLFLKLIMANPFSHFYWEGYAASLQMTHDFGDAVKAWAMAAILEEQVEHHFHAAECLFSLGEKEEGKKALQIALDKAGKEHPLRSKMEALCQISKQ